MVTPTKIWSTNDYDAAVKAMSAQLQVDSDALRITMEPSTSGKRVSVKITVSAIIGGEVKKSVSGFAKDSVISEMFLNSYNPLSVPPGGRVEMQIYRPEVMELKRVKDESDRIRSSGEQNSFPSGYIDHIRKDVLPRIQVIEIEKDGNETRKYLSDPPRIARTEKKPLLRA